MKKEELLSIVNSPKVLERTIRLSKDIDENTIDALLEKILKFYQQDPNEYIVLHSSTSGGITTQSTHFLIHPTRSLMNGNYGLPEIQEKIKYLTDLEDINLKIFG